MRATVCKRRSEYPGVLYHVMNRGDRKEPLFRDDQDRRLFLATLAEAGRKTGWHALAVCLMRANGDAHKVAIAVRLRAETAVTVRWSAARLRIGAARYVHLLVHRQQQAERRLS